jgi:rhodanese-related sulfurtransferase
MKSLTFILSLFLFIWGSVRGQVPDSIEFRSLDPYYFHLDYLKEDTALMIDVREFFEYRRIRIPDAINIPSSGNLKSSADTIDKNCALFLYCTTDYRSKRVARYFYDQGFRKLYSLEGGIVEWKKDGMPVEKKRLRRK